MLDEEVRARGLGRQELREERNAEFGDEVDGQHTEERDAANRIDGLDALVRGDGRDYWLPRLPAGSIPFFLIAAAARSEARNWISRFAA